MNYQYHGREEIVQIALDVQNIVLVDKFFIMRSLYIVILFFPIVLYGQCLEGDCENNWGVIKFSSKSKQSSNYFNLKNPENLNTNLFEDCDLLINASYYFNNNLIILLRDLLFYRKDVSNNKVLNNYFKNIFHK